jgi:putative hydrolase of the HAD superfamily
MNAKNVIELVDRSAAVLFDLFHTLTTVESSWSGPATFEILGVGQEQWHEQLLEKSRDRLAGRMKDPVEIVRSMAHAIDPRIGEDRIRIATDNRIRRFRSAMVNIPPGTLATLKLLRRRGKKLALVSNADVMEAARWPESPLKECFDAAVFSCDVGWVKPEREIYDIALGHLGVAARESVFVGDGGSGELDGAKAAGMTAVIVTGIADMIWPEKVQKHKRSADFVITHIEELMDSPA